MDLSPDDLLAPPWPHPLLAALRIARVALGIGVGLVVVALPHGLWVLFSGQRPSPLSTLFHRLVAATMGLSIEVRGERPRANTLIVANHLGWSDILALGSVLPCAFVAKSEVGTWPVLGWLTRIQPTLFVERGRRGRIAGQIAAIRRGLERGHVLMFPEGTTGDGSAVLAFRPALFAAADGFAVQPVAIRYRERRPGAWGAAGIRAWVWDGDKPFGPHFLRVIACGGAHCTITLLEPRPALARKSLAEDCRDRIVACLS